MVGGWFRKDQLKSLDRKNARKGFHRETQEPVTGEEIVFMMLTIEYLQPPSCRQGENTFRFEMIPRVEGEPQRYHLYHN